MKMGGGAKQFGIDSERVPQVMRSLRSNAHVAFKGIHIFAGSQNLNAEAILSAFEKILAYSLYLSSALAEPLEVVNLGGGFGIPYFVNDKDLNLEVLGAGLKKLLPAYRAQMPSTHFRIELGRFVVGEAGIYVSRVLYRKISRNQLFLITDGGMHHHLAASGNFGQGLLRRPFPITTLNRLDEPLEKVNVVGPLCTPLDTFGNQILVPRAEVGDLVGVMNSGAYGFTASPLSFLSHRPPVEITV
jgi:diaminopimelate decarboxylase